MATKTKILFPNRNISSANRIQEEVDCLVDNNRIISPLDSGLVALSSNHYDEALSIFENIVQRTNHAIPKGFAYFFKALTQLALGQHFSNINDEDSTYFYFNEATTSFDSCTFYDFGSATLWLFVGNTE